MFRSPYLPLVLQARQRELAYEASTSARFVSPAPLVAASDARPRRNPVRLMLAGAR